MQSYSLYLFIFIAPSVQFKVFLQNFRLITKNFTSLEQVTLNHVINSNQPVLALAIILVCNQTKDKVFLITNLFIRSSLFNGVKNKTFFLYLMWYIENETDTLDSIKNKTLRLYIPRLVFLWTEAEIFILIAVVFASVMPSVHNFLQYFEGYRANVYLFKVNNRNTRKRWNMFKVNNKDIRSTSLIFF